MRAKPEYRDREKPQVAVLDELVNRVEEGMTVLELRAAVEVEIDELEDALAALKDDGLIVVDTATNETLIKPADRVIPDEPEPETDETLSEWLRRRMPF
ncbi:DUF6432 family protein [Halobacteria archaeon AArc-dxtr1]|nr:DUF6432 family protein [Halobacteria archaeon AArc-dxtr1]